MRQLQILIVGLLLFTASTTLLAQEKKTVHEIGLNLTNLTDFALDYKVGGQNKFFHVRGLAINGSNIFENFSNVTQESFSTFLNLGYESRFKLYKKLSGTIGTGVALGYTGSARKIQGQPDYSSYTFSPGVYFALGLNMLIKEHLSLSLSFRPQVSASLYFDDTSHYRTDLNYGLNINALSLTIAYRLEVEK